MKLKEHKKVINLIKNLDSTTNKSGAIFWSGHDLIFKDETKVLQMKNDAMLMAQKLARDVHSKTLEMTDAGYALDKLAPFQELKERFAFMYNLDGLDKALVEEIGAKDGAKAQKQIQKRIDEKKKKLKTELKKTLIEEFKNANLKLSKKQKANLGEASTGAAGTMWNIISHKFSESVSGAVSAVHGVEYSFTKNDNKPDPKSLSPKEIWERGTWMKTEKSAVESKLGKGPGKVKSIVNFFTDILFVTWDNKETKVFNNLEDYRKAYKEKYKEESQLTKRPVEVDPNMERFLQTRSEFKDGKYKKSPDQKFSDKVDTVSGDIIEKVIENYANNFPLNI